MNKPEVLQIGAYPEWDEVVLNELFTMHRYFEVEDKAAFLAEKAGNIRGIATRGDLAVPGDLIAALPALEMISVYGVGYDGVDIEACKARNIRVTNTPDVLTGDVADFAVAMMLAMTRQLVQGDHWARSGQWLSAGMPLAHRACGKRAGILGLGRIGTAIAKRLAAFDMEIVYSSRAPKDHADWTYIADPVALAEACDFLFIASAATAETRHVVNREVLEALGPEGMVVNISRAANIDEDALLDALENGVIRSAALDVFEGEPALNPRFQALDNVLLQPHQGSGTFETRKAMADLVRENLLAHFAGKDLLTPVV
ncbi:MAG: 2-hydroxyacid dehydrogenase [Thiolinea sp.]